MKKSKRLKLIPRKIERASLLMHIFQTLYED